MKRGLVNGPYLALVRLTADRFRLADQLLRPHCQHWVDKSQVLQAALRLTIYGNANVYLTLPGGYFVVPMPLNPIPLAHVPVANFSPPIC